MQSQCYAWAKCVPLFLLNYYYDVDIDFFGLMNFLRLRSLNKKIVGFEVVAVASPTSLVRFLSLSSKSDSDNDISLDP